MPVPSRAEPLDILSSVGAEQLGLGPVGPDDVRTARARAELDPRVDAHETGGAEDASLGGVPESRRHDPAARASVPPHEPVEVDGAGERLPGAASGLEEPEVPLPWRRFLVRLERDRDFAGMPGHLEGAELLERR